MEPSNSSSLTDLLKELLPDPNSPEVRNALKAKGYDAITETLADGLEKTLKGMEEGDMPDVRQIILIIREALETSSQAMVDAIPLIMLGLE